VKSEQVPVERLSARRRGGGPHPTGGEVLRARVLAERPRIARASRIRELVLGFQDGLLVPLAVVTGLAGADAASSTVVVGGLAEAAAVLVAQHGAEAAPYRGFLDVIARDARDARAAIQVVLAQRAISSQLVDNLNASIHLRALLTDLFLIDEALKGAG
jgi:hypothetical protein